MSVTPYVEALLKLAATFGPAGAVLLLLCAALAAGCVGMGYVYRRDFRYDRQALRDAHVRRDRRDDMLIEVVQRNAAASEAQARASDALAVSIREAQHQQAQDLREILREVTRHD